MAGGPLANEMVCMECLGEGVLTRAVRIHEGVEDDEYRCDHGHQFGMDWRSGPATEPQWPPPAEYVAYVKRQQSPS